MENFVVSARKYRPDSFDSVVGQENITQTLKNAIGQKQLAQAYLFCGPRGVGKTTNARIFAKTINCDNLDENLNPCNECESCKAFNEQRSMNIHELDAASNNSVDNIRELIDQVRIPPQVGHYSVYIIDEVHMLSQQAFNAFLKTLEEPPSHAIFILATTEKHKILPTILSRCQVYDFNRISIKEITDRLLHVAKNENIDAEEEALQIIAQKADGAMRDALSIFDQIVSFSGEKITYENAIENLNVLDYDYYFKLTDVLLSSDHTGALLIFNDILESGFDGNYFINGLAAHFRDILVAKDTNSAELLEVGNKIKDKYLNMAAKCSEYFLINAVEIANDCDYKYKSSQNKRLHVELSLIKISNILRVRKASADKKKDTPENGTDKKTSTLKSPSSEYKTVQDKEKPEKASSSNDKGEKQNNVNLTAGSSISIKAELSKEETKEKKPEENNKEKNTYNNNEDFDEKKLNEAWLEFAEKHNDQPRLYQNLKKFTPKLKDNYLFEVEMPSESMKRVLLQLKSEILNELRTTLKNGKIDMHVVTSENPKNSILKPYTTEEKYVAMAKKNPAVQKLKNDFDMSIR